MSDIKPPTYKQYLAGRTAEALGLPHLVCRRRQCRRNNRCRWYFPSTGEPCCLRNLRADQRRIFNDTYLDANKAIHYLSTDPHWFEAREGDRRTCDDLGIAIARTDPNRWRSDQWDAERRAREKRLAQFDKERMSGKEEPEKGRG